MKYVFSECVNSFRSSAIRDLMSLATRNDIISFAGGMPGNELLPVEEMRQIAENLTRAEWEEALQYGQTGGNPSFIAELKNWLKKRNFPVEKNELIITTGSLQALNIIGKLFINPNDVVLTENPVFIGGVSAFLSYQAKIVGVDLDSNGIDIQQLTEAVKPARANNYSPLQIKPKLLYIEPNFHNPAGLVYSRERREKLLETMRGTEIPIIEDDAYGELWFDEESLRTSRPMKTWADSEMEQQILYVGSFSKIMSPGMRLAWALVPKQVYDKMSICKQSIDACPPTFSQVFAQKFMESGQMDTYILKIREIYRNRRDYMLAAIEKYFPSQATFVKPQGGFYLWVKMPDGIDEEVLFKKVVEQGAVFVLGAVFHPQAKKNGYIRISYSNTPEEQIEKGIKIIGDCLKELKPES
ncbi:MAG: PLP-dependent aminotransferase family protein [Prevotellaceae bacterium]|jgi:DNA-binding transcriptional MocR family regulator|nr:PLP-dependent aminotransferase family protein [Prevotellaceae bacterium]